MSKSRLQRLLGAYTCQNATLLSRNQERASCSALFVFLMSRDCFVALLHDATGLLQFVIVVFPDNTHYFS